MLLAIEAIDGTLHFKDYSILNELYENFSKMSEDEIIEWEKSIGFQSFRSAMNRSANEFDMVVTPEEFESWKNKYKDILYMDGDRKSTRLNSSHVAISYAVFCLKKKNCIHSH